MTITPQDKGPVLLGVLWTEVAICITFISLRYYTRKYIGGSVGWDDCLLFVTWITMVMFVGFCTAAVFHGMGVHVTKLSLDDISEGIKMLLIGQFIIALGMGISKCAVAIFLVRIVTKTWQTALLWFWIVSVMALSILLAVSVFAQCTPIESLWDATGTIPKHCTLNLTLIAKIMCAWSAAMDFFLALFPWMIIWQLNMRRKERITVCCSLSLGVIAGVCGVVRTTGLDALSQTSDYLYATSDSVMWTNSEITLTVICVSVPALRPLYKRVTGQSTSGAYYKQSQSKGFNTSSNAGAINLEYMPGQVKPKVSEYGVEIGKSSLHTDNDSDRSILGETHRQGDTTIQRVQEVTITYEDEPSSASMSRPGQPHRMV